MQTILKLPGFSDNVVTHLLSGLGGGCFAVCIGSPVDVVKSRMMGDSSYKSTLDCFLKTLKNDGPFAFYKVFIPNFGRLGSWNVIMFLTLEQKLENLIYAIVMHWDYQFFVESNLYVILESSSFLLVTDKEDRWTFRVNLNTTNLHGGFSKETVCDCQMQWRVKFDLSPLNSFSLIFYLGPTYEINGESSHDVLMSNNLYYLPESGERRTLRVVVELGLEDAVDYVGVRGDVIKDVEVDAFDG
ncbi:hypothetical protein Ahy_A02g006903 isoform E [Arachis hypogaea]|uniref:Uncharacterized protein n=1 Tax=Arachis hypogaea TaxID=3818 RepID=A0A445EAW8_ARAHY|nr:hypothetical protein Ahy_A02g006903 isoform E [Arachis hypogaea]